MARTTRLELATFAVTVGNVIVYRAYPVSYTHLDVYKRQALAYVLTLENPKRFAKSRDVGPYLGLVPKQEDSGEIQPQLGISKAGDTMLRKLLVGSAQYILSLIHISCFLPPTIEQSHCGR